jgi:excinuclease ABC subunit C
MEFEKAQELKDKLTYFEDYQGKSTVVSQTVGDVDVFYLIEDQKRAFVHFLNVVSGAVIHSHTMEMVKNLNEDRTQLLALAAQHLRDTFDTNSPEIIVPFEVPPPAENVVVTIPQRGEKKALLDLAEKNVKHYLFRKQQQELNKSGRSRSAERILKALQQDLNMQEVPWHIECFDNSNLHGTNPVASCVVFRNAKPSKGDYRKFNIKSVKGSNDFASMEEIILRRYRRMLDEGQSLPQLIIIDGGKGQLSAAMKSLEVLGIAEKTTVIGIAKRLEEIYFPGDSIPLYINKKSESLKLIQQARNEAHRFAITFHRQKRGKEITQSVLTTIPGIGEKTAEKLLQHFSSVKRLREASLDDIAAVIGKHKAVTLLKHLKGESDEEV